MSGLPEVASKLGRFFFQIFGVILASICNAAAPPGVVIDHQIASTKKYIGSPSITVLKDGSYLASHDFFGPGSSQSISANTRVFKSLDRGKSWRLAAELKDQFWSNLFVTGGQVYLMGTTYEYGRIVIRRSPEGEQWSAPAYLKSNAGFHTAPVPVVISRGKIWRAMEYHPAGPWENFEAFVLSANTNADLLDSSSWKFTNLLPYPPDQRNGKTWLEGNTVLGPDGSILDILRVDIHRTDGIEKAAILALHGNRLEFEKLVDFPGGAKKFTIRFDPRGRKYWTLSNPARKEHAFSALEPAAIRNTLIQMSSKDLAHWSTERTILTHPDPEKYAFQYVDWQFDGPDIIAVSRTAFDDESGGAHRAHDANYLTFRRIRNFRKREE